MASLKQIAANRRNAQKSTGPKTPEGKRIVSQNPVQHGLLAVNPVCLPEEQEEYERFVANMREQWQPYGFRETLILERMTDSAWRLRRVTKIETSLLVGNRKKLDQEKDGGNSTEVILGATYRRANQIFVNLSRHERQLERSYQAAQRELEILQYARAMNCDSFYIANMKKQRALDLTAPKCEHEGRFPMPPGKNQPPSSVPERSVSFAPDPVTGDYMPV